MLETILATAAERAPAVLVVDSIQTVFTGDLEGAPGNVGQVRECAARLMRFAKESGTAVFVVGHVTKGGGIAGPKTLEHIVDTVLYFEGEGTLDHRVLRATKNRFGSVDEIGVFRMTRAGAGAGGESVGAVPGRPRTHRASGSAVTAIMEGTRPMLLEIQALAAQGRLRHAAAREHGGYDDRRLALLLAVLDKRAGLSFAQLDVFVNVVGGVRLQEPAGDLAVAAALASSVYDRALPADALFLGEVGLGGEVRAVSQAERRIAEAANDGHEPSRTGRTRRAEATQPQGRKRVGVRIGERPVRDGCSREPCPRRGRRDRRRWHRHARGRRRSSSSSGGSRASRCCCTRCRRSWPRPDVVMAWCACFRRQYAGDPPPWIFQCDVDRLLDLGRRHARAASRCTTGSTTCPTSAEIVLVHDAARPLVDAGDDRPRDRRRGAGRSRRRGAPRGGHTQGSGRRTERSCVPSIERTSGARRRRRGFRAR